MNWDLGLNGLLYLAAVSIGYGLLAQVLTWKVAPKWLWAVVFGVSFGFGIVVSEVLFGWATEEDLQPNIDGLSRDEVLLIGLIPVVIAVVATRWMASRDQQRAVHDSESRTSTRGPRRRTQPEHEAPTRRTG